MEVTLRNWKMEDINDLVYHGNNANIASNLRDGFPHPYTLKDAKEFVESGIENDKNSGNAMLKAIIFDNEVIGSIAVFRQEDVACKSGELGYWLSEDYWNKGIISSAIKQICEDAFKKLELVRIYAEPFSTNVPSRKVLKNAGFKLEGIKKSSVFKGGQILDSCMYALLNNSENIVNRF